MNTILPSSIVIRRCVITALTLFSTSTLLLAPAAAQTAASDGENWELPLTSDGHPDLQGNWTNATLTPFERPENLGPVLTPEQVTALESGHADAVALRSEPSDSNRPLPPGGDDPVCIDGATTCYGEVWRDPGDRVAIVQGEPRSSLITDPVDGRVPPLTATTIEQIADLDTYLRSFGPYDHPELRPLAERCISTGLRTGPPMINGLYNNNYEIVQTPDYVVLRTEMISHARIVPLNSDHKMQALTPLFGESVGFWDGDTLVVETTNFGPLQREASISLSTEAKVLERFTRVSDAQILYEFTIEDATYYSQPWHGEARFLATEDKVYEFACHEGNYALSGILAGARRQEHDQQQ